MQCIKHHDKIQIVEQPATCPQLASRALSSTPQQGAPIIVAISLSIGPFPCQRWVLAIVIIKKIVMFVIGGTPSSSSPLLSSCHHNYHDHPHLLSIKIVIMIVTMILTSSLSLQFLPRSKCGSPTLASTRLGLRFTWIWWRWTLEEKHPHDKRCRCRYNSQLIKYQSSIPPQCNAISPRSASMHTSWRCAVTRDNHWE